MTEGAGSGEPPGPPTPAQGRPPTGGGRRVGFGVVGAGCMGFVGFYAAVITVLLVTLNRQAMDTAVIPGAILVGALLYVRAATREARAAFAVGVGAAVVVFGGCLATMRIAG